MENRSWKIEVGKSSDLITFVFDAKSHFTSFAFSVPEVELKTC